jgi:negative regulator of flagellin synthesis FlgM
MRGQKMEVNKIGGPRAIQVYQQNVNRVEDSKALNAEQAQRVGSNESSKAAEHSRRTQSDKVQLSAEAKELQKAKDIVSKAPDVREEKVEELKRQIKFGTYQVTAEQVADKILGGRVDAKA